MLTVDDVMPVAAELRVLAGVAVPVPHAASAAPPAVAATAPKNARRVIVNGEAGSLGVGLSTGDIRIPFTTSAMFAPSGSIGNVLFTVAVRHEVRHEAQPIRRRDWPASRH